MGIEITGWGKCTPPSILTNKDLETILDTDDEWIVSRTGVKEKEIAHTSLSDMGTVAAQHALAAADKDPPGHRCGYYGNLHTSIHHPNHSIKNTRKYR